MRAPGITRADHLGIPHRKLFNAGVFGSLKPHESEIPRNGANRLLNANCGLYLGSMASGFADRTAERSTVHHLSSTSPSYQSYLWYWWWWRWDVCSEIDESLVPVVTSPASTRRRLLRQFSCHAFPRATSMAEDRLDHRSPIREEALQMITIRPTLPQHAVSPWTGFTISSATSPIGRHCETSEAEQ
jgi:hypothetical protein